MRFGICVARPVRTGLPGGDAARLAGMAAPAEERPPRVDAGPDCGATHLAWIGQYEVAALSLVVVAEPVSMLVPPSPRWQT